MERPLSSEVLQWVEKSHALFPDFSDGQRRRWARAKEYCVNRFVLPIGELAVDHAPPDFLRALPRPQRLHVEPPGTWEYVSEAKRLIESKFA